MSNPEEHASGHGEMGAGRDEYSKLGSEATEVANETIGNKGQLDEHDRYRALADAARQGGDIELADRLDRHAADLKTQRIEDFVRHEVESAREVKQKLIDGDIDYGWITSGFPGGEFSGPAFVEIRKELLGTEDLSDAQVERVPDPDEPNKFVVRYVVPMKGGLQYTETYSEEDGTTDVELHKQ